jgi:hypothetical protein
MNASVSRFNGEAPLELRNRAIAPPIAAPAIAPIDIMTIFSPIPSGIVANKPMLDPRTMQTKMDFFLTAPPEPSRQFFKIEL